MKLTKKQKIELEVSKLNEKFKKTSPEKRRVLIAKDVIQQLNLNKFIAESRTYLEFNKESDFGFINLTTDDLNGSLKKHINNDDLKCTVCGIGGIFASCVRINNNISAKKYNSNDEQSSIRNFLQKWFSIEQLILIESSFETMNFDDFGSVDENLINKAIKFGKKYRTDNSRLISIMENIIKNKGIFIP